MHFGNTLRLLRVEAGVSLRELAGRIGVSGAYLSRVENGHDSAPTPDRLIAIADVLGLPPAILVELARQTGPAVDGYVRRTPEAGALFLEIARRGLGGMDIARIKAFIDREFSNRPGDISSPASRHRLTDRLSVDRIVVGVTCSSIHDLLTVAASRLDRSAARAMLTEAEGRPSERLTLLDGGFATLVLESGDGALMTILAHPLDFGGQSIRVLIVVLGSTESRLTTIAHVARLASYGPADELCAATTPERAREILVRLESLW